MGGGVLCNRMTSSNGIVSPLLALCEGNPSVCGGFPSQRPVPQSFDVLFLFICAWTNGWTNNRDVVDLRRYRAHYDVTVMKPQSGVLSTLWACCQTSWTFYEINQLRLSHGWLFYMICAWTNAWANNRDTGDLRRHRAHYDVIVIKLDTFDGFTYIFCEMWNGFVR